jgi:DNA processing protein
MKGAMERLGPQDPRFPAPLRDLPDPPETLWLQGDLDLGARRVAIVGTRRADPEAQHLARRIARDLGEAGAVVISGGAEGIDAAAHEGALEAGGATWVVQAAPLDAPYPRRHRPLFRRIVEAGGAQLSETPSGAAPRAHRFLARNRVIAALAEAVVVVQAPRRSGALSTARHARALGRPLYAIPHAPWDRRGEGGTGLLFEGALPLRGAADLRELDLPSAAPARSEVPADPILEALSASRDRGLDELVAATGWPAPALRAALIEHAVAGRVRRGAAGWRRVR